VTGAAARVLGLAAPLLPPGPLLVALSGGADSAVAAWVATRLDPRPDIVAVFVDHGWPHSAAMAESAVAVAATLGVPLRVVTVAAGDTETTARPARLAALEREAGGGAIVTGHHGGDDAETVVANLLRGAGSAGLSGIPLRRPPYIRPLLGVPATLVRDAAEELRLPYADDPSNRDPRHLRSRIRHEVLPLLTAASPGAAEALVRSGRLLAADDAALETIAARFPISTEPGAVKLPAAVLATQPEAVASRIVRRAIRTLRPPYPGSAADVAKVMAAITSPPVELSGGIRCRREGPFVTLIDPAAVPPTPHPVALAVPGTARFGEWDVEVRRAAAVAGRVAGGRPLHLDPSIGDRLIVRTARGGERIAIAGGTRPVRQVIAEAGVPDRLRAGWPVIEVRGKIAAVAGARIAAWAVPDQTSDSVLELITERSSCLTG